MRRLALCVLVALSLAACREERSPGETVGSGSGLNETVKYIHDDKRSVGCWFYLGTDSTSISCLPDKDYRP